MLRTGLPLAEVSSWDDPTIATVYELLEEAEDG